MENRTHRHPRRVPAVLAAVALVAFGLAACVDDDEPIIVDTAGGELFARYVALGNSITAGFQSAGINVALQREAYPVVLAGKAEAGFGIPALALPGCPPPLEAPLGNRIADVSCNVPPRALTPPVLVQNLAVPGADVSDVTDPLGTGTPLNGFILGGRTQLGAMIEADPTLVSIWIGNNDALGAALSGNTDALTPLEDFEAEYDEIVAGVLETEARDAILIGVAQAAMIVPALQPGAYFWAIAQDPPPGLPVLDVSDNCAPFQADGTPNPLAFNLVSFTGVAQAIGEGRDPLVIDCATGVETERPVDYLLDGTEQATVQARVDAFNAHIEAAAEEHAWIYVDPNTSLIGPALADPDLVRKCQELATADDQASFAAAVVSSCPVDLDPETATTFFGSYFSHDGVHPSGLAHQVIADTIAGRLSAKHGLDLP